MSADDHLHPRDSARRDEESQRIDAYFDARGSGKPARSMLDDVLRDASVLDDLARDREWIDEVRAGAPAPDQTLRILDRLGVDPIRFDRRRHRFTVITRRLATAAVLLFAFVIGMWARSTGFRPAAAERVETARQFERVIESLPMQIDPFDRVRGAMLEFGSTLAETEAPTMPIDQTEIRRQNPPSRVQLRPNRPVLKRATIEPMPPALDDGLIDEDIDVETLKAIYKDLGIV
ncbi:MAG: hypothetical protein IT430_02075 [Phycisphaerales bacterium]|nr:hypothetical protein [Phycisphaerales bacterium]